MELTEERSSMEKLSSSSSSPQSEPLSLSDASSNGGGQLSEAQSSMDPSDRSYRSSRGSSSEVTDGGGGGGGDGMRRRARQDRDRRRRDRPRR
eukprot:3603143-Prymnesium_polylepis.1